MSPPRAKVLKVAAPPAAAGVTFKLTGARPFVELTLDLTGPWPGPPEVPAAVKGAHVKVTATVSEENLPLLDVADLTARLTAAGAYHVRRIVPAVRRGPAVRLPALAAAPDDAARVAAFLAAAGLDPAAHARRAALAAEILREVP